MVGGRPGGTVEAEGQGDDDERLHCAWTAGALNKSCMGR